jgi:hypothetical protein
MLWRSECLPNWLSAAENERFRLSERLILGDWRPFK